MHRWRSYSVVDSGLERALGPRVVVGDDDYAFLWILGNKRPSVKQGKHFHYRIRVLCVSWGGSKAVWIGLNKGRNKKLSAVRTFLNTLHQSQISFPPLLSLFLKCSTVDSLVVADIVVVVQNSDQNSDQITFLFELAVVLAKAGELISS